MKAVVISSDLNFYETSGSKNDVGTVHKCRAL